MKTPICDFIEDYIKSEPNRLHMPAHKGKDLIGFEKYDITELSGADSLYTANGIIKQSEENSSRLFGCDSFYSAEGSSLCIRAMLYLLKSYGITRFISARNSHSAFLSACALCDISPIWLYGEGLLSCDISLKELEDKLCTSDEPSAVYITSPDYLGNIADICAISELCKKYGALLCVDCAHGAYLKFLPESLYPTDLGADICCSSAHKTLPVLTGGAYLHLSGSLDSFFRENAKRALMLFGSTSPSYLILQSLDKANSYIENEFKDSLSEFVKEVECAKETLSALGYTLCGSEPLKITVYAKSYGYYGIGLAEILERRGIYPEFADRDFLVLMLSPIDRNSLSALVSALSGIERKCALNEPAPKIERASLALTPRESVFAKSERISISDSVGRILSQPTVSCPPAVPIAVCGEIITENAKKCFEYYGIEEIYTVKE